MPTTKRSFIKAPQFFFFFFFSLFTPATFRIFFTSLKLQIQFSKFQNANVQNPFNLKKKVAMLKTFSFFSFVQVLEWAYCIYVTYFKFYLYFMLAMDRECKA